MTDVNDDKCSSESTTEDFTIQRYQCLVKLALEKYEFHGYSNIPWSRQFVLWRHDVDFSLERARALASLEHTFGCKATYFVNPHSNFYNLAELKQYQLIHEILAYGHELGLHLDAHFYSLHSESELDSVVRREADYLQELFGVSPTAFSFHNPDSSVSSFKAENYGGLVNCYSQRMMTEVAYCSDSNGFWRYQNLNHLLQFAEHQSLQVLTHPAWWQETLMSPRERIFRSVYGRAAAVMRDYDELLKSAGRPNHSDRPRSFEAVKELFPDRYYFCDYLWNLRDYPTLFLELWRLYESQIRGHVGNARSQGLATASEVCTSPSEDSDLLPGVVSRIRVEEAPEIGSGAHKELKEYRDTLMQGFECSTPAIHRQKCVFLLELIERVVV